MNEATNDGGEEETAVSDFQSTPAGSAWQSIQASDKPIGNLQGFRTHWPSDLKAGFLVFLIALPLCLGISLASGFPPLAGIFTAIVGSVVACMFSNSELTIKGPAAGLIVIVLGCIETFGGDGMAGGWSELDDAAYRATLAVCVAAAVLQIIFGIYRAGIVGEFFPGPAVHGMLAAIGIIIIAKQIPVALGVQASGEPLELLQRVPEFILESNPAIALIGVMSILTMFTWPWVGKQYPLAAKIPSPVVVLAMAIPLGLAFDLLHEHSYHLQNHQYQLGEQYLVAMPDRVFGMFQEIKAPNFSALAELRAWQWVMMFFIIGSLESILSTKAVELLDPYKRRVNMDRDMLAVGVGNFIAGMIGGLPMISEIVRSRANIDSGGKTRFSNWWHGMFLLVCVALIPMVLHLIPLAALAGMLVYTGFRLAHPSEFINVYRIGYEQLAIFLATLIAVLATDLLVGIAIGIGLKFFIHVFHGASLRSLFIPDLELSHLDAQTVRISVGDSAIFSNWIPLKRQIEQSGLQQGKNVVLDMSGTKLVDHSVMEKLHTLEQEFEEQRLELKLQGLESHQPASDHFLASRHRGLASIRRLTIVCPPEIERQLEERLLAMGATGYTALACTGMGKHNFEDRSWRPQPGVRIEIIAPRAVMDRMLEFLSREILPKHFVTACVETVDVMQLESFVNKSPGAGTWQAQSPADGFHPVLSPQPKVVE